jgi:hypothetical protein
LLWIWDAQSVGICLWIHRRSSRGISDGENSPFFTSMWSNPPIGTMFKVDGPNSNNGIGGDIVYYNLSEINFIDYDKAVTKMDTAFKRFDSRFQKAKGFLGNIILDTSSQGDDSVVEDFIKSNPYDPLIIRASSWDAKRHLNMYFLYSKVDGHVDYIKDPISGLLRPVSPKDSLKPRQAIRLKESDFDINLSEDELRLKGKCPISTPCYMGDSINDPFLLENGKTLTDKMDVERVIDIPNELLPSFRFDVKSALMDQAGVSLKSTGRFITDRTNFQKSLKIKRFYEEVFVLDFYDRLDRLITYINEALILIPRDRIIFPRFDIGVTGDKVTFAISVQYVDERASK